MCTLESTERTTGGAEGAGGITLETCCCCGSNGCRDTQSATSDQRADRIYEPGPARGGWKRSIAAVSLTVAVLAGMSLLAAALFYPIMFGAGKPSGKPASKSALVKSMGSVDALLASPEFARGKEQYMGTCIACHGPNGESRPGLGKDIGVSEFVRGLSDDELLVFIKHGRDPGDPLNTTGVAMPPKGGNPALDDAKLRDIIVFIRGLQATRAEQNGG